VRDFRGVRELLRFPNPVNEKAARVVAGGVLVLATIALSTRAYWLLAVIAAGFLLRTLFGPRVSPLALLATRVIAPRLGPPRLVAGPPKRFAQGMGAVVTGATAILALGFGLTATADVLLVGIIVSAALESIFALCLGCKVFGVLMRVGLVPQEVCADCANIWARPGFAKPPQ
jgi:hypothetical protein